MTRSVIKSFKKAWEEAIRESIAEDLREAGCVQHEIEYAKKRVKPIE